MTKTSLRRLIVHESIYDELIPQLVKVYENLSIGDPLDVGTLVGPLIDTGALSSMEAAMVQAKADGGTVHGGSRTLQDSFPDAAYVYPAIVEMPGQTDIVCDETFAPILYANPFQFWWGEGRCQTLHMFPAQLRCRR